MADLCDAIVIATTAHRGQTSKDGELYIMHPIRVMMAGRTDAERIVGVLHDAVEDTEITLEDLIEKGFSQAIVNAVDAVTGREGEDYMDFVARCKANPIARQVKLADLADNMNLERIPKLTQNDFERYQKYRRAREYLLSD